MSNNLLTPEERETIARMWADDALISEIADALGRPRSTVGWHIRRHCPPRERSHYNELLGSIWTPEMVDVLREMWDADESTAAIADRLGVTRRQVRSKARKLGLVHRRIHVTPDERARMVEMRRDGMSYTQIAAYIGCDASTVGYNLRKMGLGGTMGRRGR